MSQKIAVFSTADDGYAAASAVSLLSVRKHRPEAKLFLIGRQYSDTTKDFLAKYDITPIEVNLDKSFHTAWEYPVECYYIFAGPELLHDQGYDYSLYVDGDVYCNQDPLNFPLNKVKDFAGAFTTSTIKAILGDDAEVATALYGNQSTLEEKRIQTGIVYFNNQSLQKRQFLEKISAVYHQAIDNQIPRKGDDSLLALFRLAYPDWNYLDLGRAYNMVTQGRSLKASQDWRERDADMIEDTVFAHFTNHVKPWISSTAFPTYTFSYFHHAWRRHAIDSLSDEELLGYFPEIHQTLTDEHLRFYWYPTKNVGDLITPYFLEKVCGVKDVSQYGISEKQIDALETAQIDAQRTVKVRLKRLARRLLGRPTYGPRKRALYAVSTGSVIRLCRNHAMVYGSGVRSADQEVHPSLVRAVRGPLTRQRFLDSGYACPPTYGDPGLLLPHFYKPKVTNRKYSLGLIPHFTEYKEIAAQYKDDEDVLVIDMGCGDLEKVIDQIAACQKTISSSLHGLVLSHAYDIPTRQILYSDKIKGDGTKFRDYYAGAGIEQLDPVEAHGHKYISPSDLAKLDYETLENYDHRRLLDAMFFDENGFKKSARYPYA